MKIGIDQLHVYTPSLYLDLKDLAKARQVDPDKYTIGIGQDRMGINPITQDTVSMAANAACPLINARNASEIDMIILATESGTDYSKSGATYLHDLLAIQPFARAIEVKQACYSGTAGIMMAYDYVSNHPDRKVLVVASDIARYGLGTAGEVTQGAGAVAMIISQNPRVLTLNNDSVPYTFHNFDFWRPNYAKNALVDGKYSNQAYIDAFQKTWNEHQRRHHTTLDALAAVCFHLPYSKMGKKALTTILDEESDTTNRLLTRYEKSVQYTRQIGNIYTGSLYLGFASLLDLDESLNAGETIGFFSYGSGSVAEFFTGELVENYRHHLYTSDHEKMLSQRYPLTIEEYETTFLESLPEDGSSVALSHPQDKAVIQLAAMDQHRRIYQIYDKVEQ